MVNKLALLISHNIFLTNDQINELLEKKYIECQGVSVPVWVNAKNSKTTEPASEFFVSYQIFIEKENEDVKINKKGYEIYIPKTNWQIPKFDESDPECEEKEENWWKENPAPMDIFLINKTKYFRIQIKKLSEKIKKVEADVQHTVEIKTIESLINSLC